MGLDLCIHLPIVFLACLGAVHGPLNDMFRVSIAILTLHSTVTDLATATAEEFPALVTDGTVLAL